MGAGYPGRGAAKGTAWAGWVMPPVIRPGLDWGYPLSYLEDDDSVWRNGVLVDLHVMGCCSKPALLVCEHG